MTAYGVSSMFFHEYTSDEIFSFVAKTGLDGIGTGWRRRISGSAISRQTR